MKLPQHVLDRIDYYELKPFVEDRGDSRVDTVVLHFRKEPVLWGLFYRRPTKRFHFACDETVVSRCGMDTTMRYQHQQEYCELAAQLKMQIK